MKHLDTSFLVDLLRENARGAAGPASTLLDSLRDEPLRVSVHVLCELLAGAELARQPSVERRRIEQLCAALDVVLPDERFAPAYARLYADQERRGERIAAMDLLIATAAAVEEGNRSGLTKVL